MRERSWEAVMNRLWWSRYWEGWEKLGGGIQTVGGRGEETMMGKIMQRFSEHVVHIYI